MEPNKLEQEIKKKLEQRTIQPSDMAWDRLDAMLSVTEKKKPKRAWLYIAASFVGFLLVGILFLKQGESGSTVIENPGNGIVTIEKPAVVQEPVDVKEITGHQAGAVVAVQDSRANKPAVKKIVPNNEKAAEDIAVVHADNIEEAAVAANGIRDNDIIAGEAEVLLAVSQSDDMPKNKKKGIKVDSKSLLSSVENELDESFRTKALQTVTKNYYVVKTSLANRNYE